MNFQIIQVAEASIGTLMKSINRVILNPLIIFLFALAVVYFMYGVARYLISPGNEEVRQSSKTHMFWGIIGMFIMVSVFGILNIIMNTLGVENIKFNNSEINITIPK